MGIHKLPGRLSPNCIMNQPKDSLEPSSSRCYSKSGLTLLLRRTRVCWICSVSQATASDVSVHFLSCMPVRRQGILLLPVSFRPPLFYDREINKHSDYSVIIYKGLGQTGVIPLILAAVYCSVSVFLNYLCALLIDRIGRVTLFGMYQWYLSVH